jgi:hypothetical protein
VSSEHFKTTTYDIYGDEMKKLSKSVKQIKWLAMQNRSKNLFRFVCSGSVSYFRFGVWWRWSRLELPLKQQLVVWVIPNWDQRHALLVGRAMQIAASHKELMLSHK